MAEAEKNYAGAIAPPPVIYGVAFLIGWLIDRWYPLAFPTSGLIDFIGGLFIGFGLVLNLVAASELRSASTTILPYRPSTAIVETGPFKHTRNPIYVGVTLIYIGLAIIIDTVWPLVLLPVVLILIDRGVIAREERYLSKKFGIDYDSYRSRVRRWI